MAIRCETAAVAAHLASALLTAHNASTELSEGEWIRRAIQSAGYKGPFGPVSMLGAAIDDAGKLRFDLAEAGQAEDADVTI